MPKPYPLMIATTVAYKSCRTCLTNRMGSISHHIMPLVINSPRGGYTYKYTYTYTHIHTDIPTETILRNQVCTSLLHAWFKNSYHFEIFSQRKQAHLGIAYYVCLAEQHILAYII